jgi:hypothetical protein
VVAVGLISSSAWLVIAFTLDVALQVSTFRPALRFEVNTFAVAAIALTVAAIGLIFGSAWLVTAPTLDVALQASTSKPALRLGVDTLAFANENRTIYRGKRDLYPNWCFVMARAITQFHRFARFDPAAPRLTSGEYTERVRQITARAPWRASLPPGERLVIPGYASLYEFSRAQEKSVKAGLTGRLLSWIDWSNWRVVFPMPGAQQEGVARETLAELQAGRPVQWLVTNLPVLELNHTVVVYAYRADDQRHIEFMVYDPNDPLKPGIIRFDRIARRFASTRLYNTSVGTIRAFRMYFSPIL